MKHYIVVFTIAYGAMLNGLPAERPERKLPDMSDDCHFYNIAVYPSAIPGSNPVAYYLSDQELERLEQHHKKCGWEFNPNTVQAAVAYHFYHKIDLDGQMKRWVQQQQQNQMREEDKKS